MHANVADTGESIPRCSYPVFLLSFPNLCKSCKDLLGQFWQIIFALNLAGSDAVLS